ncbi:DinB family protein [Natronosporangium hydrolyticum]|uniref:DinB family protein n=1 Tax=Natronosporangium hydrolyticum TaxID=2811111 RepID=A0A895YFN3_9ACTN|nr:DinB family protein [Natronosporangium hydrolyticum]QSB16627.1 DinB family protein [Natronosporangium hydrolyticum]
MTIIPDRKNWTWVLERACPECGFAAQSIPREQIPARLRACADQWRLVLSGVVMTGGAATAEAVRQRPRPDVWSPLEYGCHVRDVCRRFSDRLAQLLAEEAPVFADWDQDAAAVAGRYAEQEPARVAAELVAAAARLADGFEAVTGEQWRRTGSRSDGAQFTVESLGRYFLHDPVHHLHDVGVLRR